MLSSRTLSSSGSVRRYYDPATGQFISIDPLVDQTEAPYGYAGQNPVNNYDLGGTMTCWNGPCGGKNGGVACFLDGAGRCIVDYSARDGWCDWCVVKDVTKYLAPFALYHIGYEVAAAGAVGAVTRVAGRLFGGANAGGRLFAGKKLAEEVIRLWNSAPQGATMPQRAVAVLTGLAGRVLGPTVAKELDRILTRIPFLRR